MHYYHFIINCGKIIIMYRPEWLNAFIKHWLTQSEFRVRALCVIRLSKLHNSLRLKTNRLWPTVKVDHNHKDKLSVTCELNVQSTVFSPCHSWWLSHSICELCFHRRHTSLACPRPLPEDKHRSYLSLIYLNKPISQIDWDKPET